MHKQRIDKWKNPKSLGTGFTGNSQENVDALNSLRLKKEKADSESKKLTINDWIADCKELIYAIKDGKPVFHCIMFSLNAETVRIEISHIFDILIEYGEAERSIDAQITKVLAYAAMTEVPVYPNTKELSEELALYHRQLLLHGFTARDSNGTDIRLVLTKKPGKELLNNKYIEKLDLSAALHPAEIELLRGQFREELQKRDNAGQTLTALELAIDQLSELTEARVRNESALQMCLTQNPILFGVEYCKVVPKHQLGAEYQMDYALERASGQIDFLEIEPSNFRLFTRAGNPTSHLIHAEQQIMDWLHWVEENAPYARKNLPGLTCPIGFVVIGRKSSLSESDVLKLRRRNAVFRGTLEILSYDDLLDRSKNLLKHLTTVGRRATVKTKQVKGRSSKRRNT